jgi:hypothetical protein
MFEFIRADYSDYSAFSTYALEPVPGFQVGAARFPDGSAMVGIIAPSGQPAYFPLSPSSALHMAGVLIGDDAGVDFAAPPPVGVVVGKGVGTIQATRQNADGARLAAKALLHAFTWDLSPEGHHFWDTIYARLVLLAKALEPIAAPEPVAPLTQEPPARVEPVVFFCASSDGDKLDVEPRCGLDRGIWLEAIHSSGDRSVSLALPPADARELAATLPAMLVHASGRDRTEFHCEIDAGDALTLERSYNGGVWLEFRSPADGCISIRLEPADVMKLAATIALTATE